MECIMNNLRTHLSITTPDRLKCDETQTKFYYNKEGTGIKLNLPKLIAYCEKEKKEIFPLFLMKDPQPGGGAIQHRNHRYSHLSQKSQMDSIQMKVKQKIEDGWLKINEDVAIDLLRSTPQTRPSGTLDDVRNAEDSDDGSKFYYLEDGTLLLLNIEKLKRFSEEKQLNNKKLFFPKNLRDDQGLSQHQFPLRTNFIPDLLTPFLNRDVEDSFSKKLAIEIIEIDFTTEDEDIGFSDSIEKNDDLTDHVEPKEEELMEKHDKVDQPSESDSDYHYPRSPSRQSPTFRDDRDLESDADTVNEIISSSDSQCGLDRKRRRITQKKVGREKDVKRRKRQQNASCRQSSLKNPSERNKGKELVSKYSLKLRDSQETEPDETPIASTQNRDKAVSDRDSRSRKRNHAAVEQKEDGQANVKKMRSQRDTRDALNDTTYSDIIEAIESGKDIIPLCENFLNSTAHHADPSGEFYGAGDHHNPVEEFYHLGLELEKIEGMKRWGIKCFEKYILVSEGKTGLINNSRKVAITACGEYYYSKKQFEKALEFYKKMTTCSKKNLMMGKILLFLKQRSVAYDCFLEITQMNRVNPSDLSYAYYQLGKLEQENHQTRRAIEFYKKSVSKDSYRRLGMIYENMKSKTEKQKEYYIKMTNHYYKLGAKLNDRTCLLKVAKNDKRKEKV
jgi:tetratricopeptide (TPR) repeat protein